MTQKIAVVVTDSDDRTAAAIFAEDSGYQVNVLRRPSVQAITKRLPDWILIDWAPRFTEEYTGLIDEIRSTAAIRQVPIFVLYSIWEDVPKKVLATDRVYAFEIPIGSNVIQRAIRKLEPANPVTSSTTPVIMSSTTPVVVVSPVIFPRARIFIGHGQSQLWRELSEFLERRLGLSVVEFNREPAAGMPTTERLEQMLADSDFAFLLFTAEDASADGTIHARENVIHEAGLFQGKLGFKRAIIILEEGCKEFSNIVGLGQIRLMKQGLSGAFEEIRRVLEREGVIAPP